MVFMGGRGWEPDPAVNRKEAAEDYVASVEEYARLRARHRAEGPVGSGLAWIRRASDRPRVEQCLQLHRSAMARLENLSAGQEPGAWGLLSGGHSAARGSRGEVRLERTLRRVAAAVDDVRVQEQVKLMSNRLPRLRAQVELGLPGAVQKVKAWEEAVADLAALDAVGPLLSRSLLEHLPGDQRPLAGSVEEMDRPGPPVCLRVTYHGPGEDWGRNSPEPWIELNDIVVRPRALRGSGLGTAALVELCRFADHHQYPIQGMLEPGPGAEEVDEVIPRLAGWYARHGFTQEGRDPARWQRRGKIRREPAR